MAGPMLLDIRRQAATLSALLDRADNIRHQGRVHVVPPAGGRILAVASGDGWFAARATQGVTMCGFSLPYVPCSSLGFLCYEAPRTGPGDRVVAISMSGNVDRVVSGVAMARARGARPFLLTNGSGGRLGQGVEDRCSLDIPDVAPFLCGTSTYTATLLALWLLLDGAAEAGRRASDWRLNVASVGDTLALLPAFIDAADAFAQQAARDAATRSISGIRFLSAGANLATADYGAAKCVELTKVPAWSDDIEEFAHRQYWSMPAGDLVVYLSANREVSAYANQSAAALAELGVCTVSIETPDCPVPGATRRLVLPAVDEWLSPLLLAIPIQCLSYHLAESTGLDPNTRSHLKNDTARFLVSRKLTRRDLIGTGQ